MAKPITFSQVNAIEPLDSSRFQVQFPTIEGFDGSILTLHHAEVSIPNRGIAQIGVKYLGNTANFRGASQNDNILTISFIEGSNSEVVEAIFAWMRICRNSNDGTSRRKAEYAQEGMIYLFDTKGEIATKFLVHNMWPMQITMPQLGESSGPVKYEVQFSIDALSLNSEESGDDAGPPAQVSPAFLSPSLSDRGSNLSSGIGSSISGGGGGGSGFSIGLGGFSIGPGGISGGISGALNTALGTASGGISIGANGLQIGGGAKIGPFNLSVGGNIPLPVNALTLSQFTSKFSGGFSNFFK